MKYKRISIKNLLAAFGCMVLIYSCTKEETKETAQTTLTTAQKLQNKWTVNHFVDFNYKGANTDLMNIDTTYTGRPADYYHFRSDNKIYTLLDGVFDTLSYNLLNDNLLTIGSEQFSITKLSEAELQLTFYERSNSPYFDNVLSFIR